MTHPAQHSTGRPVAGTGPASVRESVAAALAAHLNGPAPAGPGPTGPQRLAKLHRLPPGAASAPRSEGEPDAVPPAADLYVSADPEAVPADTLLGRLRWGGVLVLLSPNARASAARQAGFAGAEWLPESDPFRLPPWPLPPSGVLGPVVGWPGRPAYVQAFRKVGHEPFDRPHLYHHSFDVRLARDAGQHTGFRVVKQVPRVEQIRLRLARHAEVGGKAMHANLDVAARKLCNKIFPVFLTREAAFLKILAERLPDEVAAGRFPRILDTEKDDRGFIKRIEMTWLRLGGEPMTGHTFATGAASLAERIHRAARIAHLDLRLDNFVITDAGVCLVDFGSAVRIGEDLDAGGMLSVLLHEMLSASRISQDLRRMQAKDRVTSAVFDNAYKPPGPAVDLYSLAQNLTALAKHPEFRGLVHVGPREAAAFSKLRRRILRPPTDGSHKPVETTLDLLRQLRLHRGTSEANASDGMRRPPGPGSAPIGSP